MLLIKWWGVYYWYINKLQLSWLQRTKGTEIPVLNWIVYNRYIRSIWTHSVSSKFQWCTNRWIQYINFNRSVFVYGPSWEHNMTGRVLMVLDSLSPIWLWTSHESFDRPVARRIPRAPSQRPDTRISFLSKCLVELLWIYSYIYNKHLKQVYGIFNITF